MTEVMVPNKVDQKHDAILLKNYQVPPFFIDTVDLDVALYEDCALVTSELCIRRNRQMVVEDIFLNGEELVLESLQLDGAVLPADRYVILTEGLVIKDVPDNFKLTIVTKIFPDKNTALSGLYRSQNTYCTQCEPEGFRRITYFMDRPDVLSRFSVRISADAAKYPVLLSNGNLIEGGDLDGGRHWVRWEDPFKKSCYLFALVAGDFDLIEDQFITQSKRRIILRIYVEKGYGDQAHHAMHAMKTAMRWDETAYGREYDLDIYMIVAIGDFNMGAMENKGLNIFNTKYVLAKPETATDDDYVHILSVVGHEYFHNWTGNRVTCRDWFQLSLKEGLTIFRDQSFSEDIGSHAVMRIRDVTRLREAQFAEDAGPLAHPVRPESYIEINNFYTATIYEKGAEILRMLQTILGKELFRKGTDLYFAMYDGQAVTIDDFVNVMADVSGIDLTQFRHWYSEIGTPMVTVTDDYDDSSHTYTLHMTQQGKHALHIPIRVGLLYQTDKVTNDHDCVLSLTKKSQSFKFANVPARPIPSLLRHFSAPIKLQYAYTNDDLVFLCKHDQDDFNRWEAGQKYALNILLGLIRDIQSGKSLVLPRQWFDLYHYLLTTAVQDKLLLAEMLILPSEKYIAEQMEVVDVDAIHAAREFTRLEMAKHAEKEWLAIYQRDNNPSGHYVFNMEEMGKRQLKNTCLSYLMLLPQHHELGWQQFQRGLSTNMTDTQAALVSLASVEGGHQALDAFYATWQQDALVVDKWLSIQATSKLPGALARVRELLRHPAFDIKNPNKVYALIGSFCARNAAQFHAIDGAGYVFLRECVQQLNKINPQIAARMVNPLTSWKRYDKERQQLMRKQLETLLLDKKLSSDVYELVTKSL